MPNALAMTSESMPEHYQSTMIGVLFLFISFGGYISGYIASDFHKVAEQRAFHKSIFDDSDLFAGC